MRLYWWLRSAALGRMVAEFVIPYPPGLLLLAPGELIDPSAQRAIDVLAGAGRNIVGPADAKLHSLRVLMRLNG